MLNEFSMKYSEQGIIFINYNQALKCSNFNEMVQCTDKINEMIFRTK